MCRARVRKGVIYVVVAYAADFEEPVVVADAGAGNVVDWDGVGAEGAVEGLNVD